MDAFARPDPEALVAHAAALRALARGLVGGDPHTAEDLVQETWARALEHPPRHTDRLRGWLATVLASVAAKRRRTEARRASRERRTARPEVLTSEVELAHEHEERKRVLRLVSDALLALEEPYQSTLLLRYYEGLTPTEIARRTGAPLATVKSRLQRGLAHLRAQLDETAPRASWMPALCGLTGIGPSRSAGLPIATATSVATGALVMSQKSKLVLGALLLLLLGLATWRALAPEERRGNGQRAALSPPAPTPDRARGADDERRAPLEQAAAARVAQATIADTQPEVPEPGHEHRLTVLVLDEDDLPLSGARVYLAPANCPLNAVGRTNTDGELELRWFSHGRRMELALLVVHDAWGTSGLRRIETDRRDQTYAVQLRVPWFASSDDGSASRRAALAELGSALPDSGTGRGLEPDASGDAEVGVLFADPWTRTVHEEQAREEYAQFALDLATQQRIVELSERLAAKELASSRPRAFGVSVRGTAFDGSGAPAEGVLVVARHPGGSERTHSDERGAFAFYELEAGKLSLRAGGGDHPIVRDSFHGHAGLTVFWDPRLARGLELRGRVVDRRGAPRAGWIVELRTDDRKEVRADTALCATDGSFAFPDVPAGRHELALRPTDRPGGVPSVLLEKARTGRELELRVDEKELPDCSVQVRLEDANGAAVENGELRLWTRSGAHGIRLVHLGEGLYAGNKLPPGRYRLEASRPGSTWVERGLLLRSGANDERAPLKLERDGRLVVTAPERETPVRWLLFEETGDVDRFVGERETTGGWERKLRAGRFVLRTGEREQRFVVRNGETTRVGP